MRGEGDEGVDQPCFLSMLVWVKAAVFGKHDLRARSPVCEPTVGVGRILMAMYKVVAARFDEPPKPKDCLPIQPWLALSGMDSDAVFCFHGFADGAYLSINAGNFALEPLWVQVGDQLANNLFCAAETHIEGDVQNTGWGMFVGHGQAYLFD